MTGVWVAAVAGAALVVGASSRLLLSSPRARRHPRRAVIDRLSDATSVDPATGAVTSVQAADLTIEADALDAIWTPGDLERLARTYWRFLTRVTLGLIRVRYTERERSVVLLVRPLRLLTFQAPEYEMSATRGLVRWRIARGLLVARRGRDGGGHLQIEVVRGAGPGPRPRPSSRRGRGRQLLPGDRLRHQPAPLQHHPVPHPRVITYGFLRSLTRLDLAESRVGRLDTGP